MSYSILLLPTFDGSLLVPKSISFWTVYGTYSITPSIILELTEFSTLPAFILFCHRKLGSSSSYDELFQHSALAISDGPLLIPKSISFSTVEGSYSILSPAIVELALSVIYFIFASSAEVIFVDCSLGAPYPPLWFRDQFSLELRKGCIVLRVLHCRFSWVFTLGCRRIFIFRWADFPLWLNIIREILRGANSLTGNC